MEKKLNGVSVDKIEPLDTSVKENYSSFKEEITRQAITSLRERIPQKILYFNSVISENAKNGYLFNSNDLDKESYRRISGKDSASKKPKRSLDEENQTLVPSHKQIFNELEKIKLEASELIEILGNIKLWIQLNVPRIEDGNNFGVGIQEEVIQELTRVEDTAFNLYDAIVKYYMARAKLSTKVLKYPNVDDYGEAIRELDEKEWIHIKITKVDMRNNYSMLYDLLCKNWEKIVKPKSEDGRYRMTF
ncbi:subunit of proteaseome activator complex, putative [Theileria equi strain WA]|uniref:Subunit of proteaseome activator complex, putative n=1 Tax=Theileria equi strain WA TaxID=1537102 RepID=L0AYH6_THEEQ|nr:subunit of proteaseome activator complex, putative [Theileria equi strain WA]AFZ80620.1 subunit of proteaseome activator complex, putative [Theileria equi strain WA]|eukprot:XP_004830286.1 subunit of proteaseome activator complex, putative [Theileria equi strain WA]